MTPYRIRPDMGYPYNVYGIGRLFYNLRAGRSWVRRDPTTGNDIIVVAGRRPTPTTQGSQATHE